MSLLHMHLVVELKDGDKRATLTRWFESPHVPQIGSCFRERGCDESFAVDMVEWFPTSFTFNVELRPYTCRTALEFEDAVKRWVGYGWEVQNPKSDKSPRRDLAGRT